MIIISGTKEELLKFTGEFIPSECPRDTKTMSKEKCYIYQNCEECALDNEKRFIYKIIE